MAITVASVVSRAQTILQDTTGIRWPEHELVDWVNDAQREIVVVVPQAGAVTESVALTPGSKQTLPSDGAQFLRVVRNMGGRAIRAADRDILDSQIPDWHEATGPEVVHYVHDGLDPRTFYVYPSAVGQIELIYAKSPANVTASGDLNLPDLYANAVLEYTLYRAYSKDAEATANKELAEAAYGRFMGALGVRATTLQMSDNPTQVQRPSAVGS